MSWGGSSLAGPVLTVSTQPEGNMSVTMYFEIQRFIKHQHTGDGQLALTLQESSIGDDELLRLIYKKDPISKYSVVRSLATPSRLLLDPSKNIYILFIFFHLYNSTLVHSFVYVVGSEAQTAGYFSTQAAVALRRRPQHRSIGGFDDIFFFFFGGKLRDRRGRSLG